MNIEKYLERINVSKHEKLSYLYLAQLQINHILTIPFENLDIQAKIPIDLTQEKLFEKIIVKRRGGFCYELNFLFFTLLINLGFEVKMVSAQFFHFCDNKFAPPFDHLALIVKLDKNYLVDVGFGDSFRVPIPIPDGQIKDISGTYRVFHSGGEDYYLQILRENDWQTQYKFGLNHHPIEDFFEMCIYHQTSPDTIFTQKKLCTIANIMGRVTLADESLTITQNRLKEKFIINDLNEFNEKLKEYFGMDFFEIMSK